MIVLAVTWKAHDGHETEVARLFSSLQDASRKEPGCLMYLVHRHKTDQRRFFIYEQYEDDAALEAHRNSDHFQQIAVAQLRNIATRIDGELYTPLNA
ncbi:MAG TPA: putative quinol monooxygenase [Terriglobales bacterium]|nr:putative quinol monooxygenase [Terriglobales bacterium]